MTKNKTTSIEEFDDNDDDIRPVSLGAVDDFNTAFELPLKPKFLQSENFSDLTSEWEQSRSNTPGLFNSMTEKVQSHSVADFSRNRTHVEQLLQSANEMNNYLSQNIESINSFQVGLLNGGKGLYSSMIDDSSACINGTNLSSTSNFGLSDDELEDTTGCTSSIFDKDLLRQQNVSKIPRRKSSLFKPSAARFEIGDCRDVEEHDIEESHFSECSSIASFDIGGLHISPPHDHEKDHEKPDLESQNPLLCGISGDVEVPHIPVGEALENLKRTIDLLLKLSNNKSCIGSNSGMEKKEYANFYMKSKPSLSSVDFLKRIQDKCKYEPTVYLVAMFLIEMLFLTRNKNGDDGLQLKRKLKEKEVHRVIIAAVRLSTKLLEDYVHSHEYFSKVCGISKRLLTKLEVSLLICLCNNELMISNKKLAASQFVLNELLSCCK